MKSRYITILTLLLLHSSMPAMEQRPATGPATAAAITRSTVPAERTSTQQADIDDPVVLPADLPELPPIFIARDQEQDTPQFSIDGSAVVYSRTLQTMREVVGDATNQLYPIQQYSGQQLDFIANLLNFLYREQQKTGSINNDRIIAFITTHTNSYRAISFDQTLELINFFDIPDAFAAITSVQPLPLPMTPASENEYNKQLAYVFYLARTTTYREDGIVVGSEQLWQLFGRMLYPNCTKYPEIAQMINFITAQRGGKFVQTVRKVGQRIGSWLGAPKPSERIVQKNIEDIVLSAYMQQHPELYTHILRTIAHADRPVFSPDGKTIAIERYGNVILINIHDGTTIRKITRACRPKFSSDGKMIAIAKDDNVILINIHDGNTVRTIAGADGHVFSPDGKIIAIWENDSVYLINIRDGTRIRTFTNAYIPAFSPDGNTLAIWRDDNVILINIHDGTTIGTIAKANSLVLSPDGKIIAIWRVGGGVYLINIPDGTTIRIFTNANNPAFSPDGNTLAITKDDNVILINIHDGTTIGTIAKAFNPVFSPDGNTFASISLKKKRDSAIQLGGYQSLREALNNPI